MVEASDWTPLLLSAAAAIPLLLVGFTRPVFRGFGFWVAGSVTLCVAGGVRALAGHAPGGLPVAVLIGNLLLAAYGLLFIGCRCLRDRPVRSVPAGVLLAVWLAVDLWMSSQPGLARPAADIRHLASALLLLSSVATLLRQRPPYFGAPDGLLAGFMTLVALYHLLRLAPWSAAVADPLWLTWGALNTPALSVGAVALTGLKAVGFGTSQLLLLYERTAWEHQQACLAPRRHVLPDAAQRQDAVGPVKTVLREADRAVESRPVLLTARSMDDGTPVSGHGMAPLQQLQDSLHRSEERYRHAMAASRDGIWDWHCRDDVIHFSSTCLNMLGESASTPVLGTLDQLVERLHPDDRHATLAFISDCIRHDESHEVELRLRHQQGHYIWVLSRAMVVQRQTNGSPERVVGTCTDISAHKQLEQRLTTTLAWQHTLLQAAPLGICEIHGGRLVHGNHHLQALLTQLPVTTGGGHLHDLIPPPELQALEALGQQPDTAHGGAGPLISTERPVRYRDGQTRWLRLHAQSISGRGLLYDGILITEDVTEQRRTTDELIRSRDAADSAVRAAQGLLANVRHEVNTPLNAIMGFAELLGLQSDHPQQRQAAQHIHQAAVQLHDMLQQLQALAATYAQPLLVREHILQPQALCAQAIAAFEPAARQKGLQLQARCDEVPAQLHSDPQLLLQALSCLLDNAVTHTAQGQVRVDMRLDTTQAVPRLCVEVSDDGPGVPAGRRAQLFKPFIASDFSDTRESTGMGLGLSMVQRIAQALGGQAYYQPRQPAGSVFGFTVSVRVAA